MEETTDDTNLIKEDTNGENTSKETSIESEDEAHTDIVEDIVEANPEIGEDDIMEEIDIRSATPKNTDLEEAKITFNFEFKITNINMQSQLTEIPEDLKQPILMMEHGKSIPSLLPDNKIMLFESPVLMGEEPIKSIEELRQTCNELLTKPLYGVITTLYKRQNPKHRSKYWTATLDVLINTSHPLIQALLKTYFDEAIRYMESGTKFCMEISFAEALKEVVAKIAEPFDHKSGKGCVLWFSMYLSNCSKRSEICYSPRAICFCFLCWIFAGPCYMMHRYLMVKDIKRQFSRLPVVFVNQKGDYEIICLDGKIVPTTYKY